MTSSWSSCGCEAKDGRFDDVGCGAVKVALNYPSLVVIFQPVGVFYSFGFRYK
jgi:hypothetical protein